MFNCFLCLFVLGADVHLSHGSICQTPKNIPACRSESLYNLKGKIWYWYFIAKIKHARIGIGMLLVYKSLQCPTLGYITQISLRQVNLTNTIKYWSLVQLSQVNLSYNTKQIDACRINILHHSDSLVQQFTVQF